MLKSGEEENLTMPSFSTKSMCSPHLGKQVGLYKTFPSESVAEKLRGVAKISKAKRGLHI